MKVLVAGVGNIFLGDDGFGVEVASVLEREAWPDGVEVVDFGIRGVHLAYQLLDGYDALVLVDAMQLGETPGTLSVFEPEIEGEAAPVVDGHGLDPASVLALLERLGGSVRRVLVVGCEPETIREEIALSDTVAAAVPRAVAMVREVVSELCAQAVPATAGVGVQSINEQEAT